LKHNTTANDNTADGFQALFNNSTGANNTAVGHHALFGNSTGSNNIALGRNAGNNLTIGNNNIDIGTGGTAGESNTIRIGSAQTRTFIKGISGAVVSGAPVVVNALANSESPHRQGVSRMRLKRWIKRAKHCLR
jgi:hypothetical protein